MSRKFTSPETKETVLKLWNSGLSTRKIGLKLGVSTNSIAGIVRRLKLAGLEVRTEVKYTGLRKAKAKTLSKRKQIIKSEIVPKGFRQPKRVTKSKERWVPLLALADKTCRYTQDGKLYCNIPTIDGGYCEEHYTKMYNRSTYIPAHKKV